MPLVRTACIALAIQLMLPSQSPAQESPAWPERIFVTIDVPAQLVANDFSESISVVDTIRRSENATFGAVYPLARGAGVDVGAAVRVYGRLGAGATGSYFQRSHGASFDVAVPNPFVANQPLRLSGTVSKMRHREGAVHFQGIYALSLVPRVRVMFSGGPSVFHIAQDIVGSVDFTINPGFQSMTLDQTEIKNVKETAIGFNVGANATWTLASHLGLGTIVRYARAKLTFDPGSRTGVTRAIEMNAGGLHIGGGVRLLF